MDEVNKPTQESINEKLDTINKSTRRVGDIIKEINSENEIISSNLIKNTFESLENTTNSLKLNKDEYNNYSILKSAIKPLGGDKILVNDSNIYEFTPEIHKALSKSSYTGKSMKNENVKKNLYNFLTDIGYNGDGDQQTSQKKFFIRLFNQYRNIKKEEPSDLIGRGVKIIIPSNIIDTYSGLEVLLGLKISGHTDTLTEASNLIDELYNRGEKQNKQQYRNAPNKFQT